MQPFNELSRRKFLAASGTVVAAGGIGGQTLAASSAKEQLAIDGGPKAVQESVPLLVRWGKPEREQLNALMGQQSIFYWRGPQTALFVERFQKICPVKHVMTCSSGTASLHIAVAAAGIAPGDEVITTPIMDIGTVIGVLYQQAVPVFADLGPSTYNLDPADVERKITPRTKAIIAVNGRYGGRQRISSCKSGHWRAVTPSYRTYMPLGSERSGEPINIDGQFTVEPRENRFTIPLPTSP